MAEKNKRFGWLELALTVLAAGAIGFYLGTVFLDAYRSGKPAQTQTTAVPQAAPAEDHAAEKARIRVLQAETTAHPDNAAAWVELGNLFFDTHQPAQAVGAYQTALKLGAGSADVWTDLGIMQRELGRFQEALAAFDKAIALDPRHDNARFNKGVVLLHDLNDRAGALAAWEELVRIRPDARTPDGQLLSEVIKQARAMP